jgi:hypothetical protein
VAKKGMTNDLMQLALVGGGAYIGYRFIVNAGKIGQLPEFLQTFMHGVAPGTFPAGLGAGTLPSGGTGGGSTAPCAFQAGWRYVTPTPNNPGQFSLIWKGVEYARYSTQAMAEQSYNARVAAEGCV